MPERGGMGEIGGPDGTHVIDDRIIPLDSRTERLALAFGLEWVNQGLRVKHSYLLYFCFATSLIVSQMSETMRTSTRPTRNVSRSIPAIITSPPASSSCRRSVRGVLARALSHRLWLLQPL